MTTYVTYTRVSTRKQGKDGLGIKSQQAILDHYLKGKEVVASFSEVASAKDIAGRPELQKAIKLCVDGGHTLAVAKVDRLSRRTEHALKIWGQLDQRLLSCDIPQENGLMPKFNLTLFMAFADRERELIRIRTKVGLAQSDKPLGKHPKQQANYLTDDQRARGQNTNRQQAINGYRPTLEYMQMLRKKGLSYKAIADRLNETEHKTRTRIVKGKEVEGGTYYATTVKRILDRATA